MFGNFQSANLNKDKRPIISPGQALLILIDHYKNDPEKWQNLKNLYLVGIDSSDNEEKINNYLQDSLLSNYVISSTPKDINKDPVRRFFETHLAWETLQCAIDKIELIDLMNYLALINDHLSNDSQSAIITISEGKYNILPQCLQSAQAGKGM